MGGLARPSYASIQRTWATPCKTRYAPRSPAKNISGRQGKGSRDLSRVSFPPGAPPRRGGVFCFCSFGAPCSSKTPPPRPLTLASSLRMGPLGAGACCCAALAKGSARCAVTYGRRSSSSAAHNLITHTTAVTSLHTHEMRPHYDTRENASTRCETKVWHEPRATALQRLSNSCAPM